MVGAFIATTSNCADGDASAYDAIAIDTLASGTIQVSNPATGAWGDEPAWQLTEQVRIGAIDGGGAGVFGEVRGIAVSSNGNVHVLDHQANEVRVFTPDGVHVRTLGGHGAGPGELDQPFGLAIDGRGRIWTADRGNGRYTVWDSAGSLLGTRPRPIAGRPFDGIAGFDGDRLVEHTSFFEPPSSSRPVLLRVSLDDSVPIDTLNIPPSPLPTLRYLLPDERGGNRMSADVLYAPAYDAVVADSGHYWLGASDRYRLHQLTLDGDTVRTVQREYTPIPVTAAERDSAANTAYLVRMRQSGAEVDPARIPEHKPAYHSMSVDRDGYLWVRQTPLAGRSVPVSTSSIPRAAISLRSAHLSRSRRRPAPPSPMA